MILRGEIQIGGIIRQCVFKVCPEDADKVPIVEREYNVQEAAKYFEIDRKTFRIKARKAGLKKNNFGKYPESELLKLKSSTYLNQGTI